MKTMIGSSIALSLLVTGCSASPAMQLAPLDSPAVVLAKGAEQSSEVTIYRQGSIDPSGSSVTLHVQDGAVMLRSTADAVTVQELTLALDDVDLSATADMPKGVHLRNQTLSIVGACDAQATQKEPDALTAHGHSSMVYRASLLLDDGSLSPLGPVTTPGSDFDVRATRYEFGVHVTVDSGPQGQCWSIPGVIDVSDCSMYVELDGDAAAIH